MDTEEWYYANNGEQAGPISFADLQNKWKNNEMNVDTMVWCSLLTDWKIIRDYEELYTLLNPPKQKMPPPIPAKPSEVSANSEKTRLFPKKTQAEDSSRFGIQNVEETQHSMPHNILKEIQSSGRKHLNHVETEAVPVSKGSPKVENRWKTSSSQGATTQAPSASRFPVADEIRTMTEKRAIGLKKPVGAGVLEERIVTSAEAPTRRDIGGNGWEERLTVDGVPYYFNKASEGLSWEKPDCLKSEQERKEGSSKWAWIEDDREGWVPVAVDSESNGKVTGRREDGGTVRNVKSAGIVHWSSLRELPDDVVLLEDTNEPSILYTVRKRYMNNSIYTWVGSNKTILLSVNPFQSLPLYSPDDIYNHSHPPPNKALPPHVYDIAYSAFEEMATQGTDQSILISGESGAGKTEATKQCLGFIAEIAGSDSSLEQKILQTNPVLEAFGNAKTVRNNNSSRFGKWIEIHFSDSNKVCGASIESYLLEKSRVVSQQENERNFHIFYQLFTSQDICKQYHLTQPGDYRYLTGGKCLSVAGIDDESCFIDVLSSFEALNFSSEECDWIYGLLAAILNLGNIHFIESHQNAMHPGAKVDNTDVLAATAQLLQISSQSLEEAVCCRRIVVKEGSRDSITIIPLNCDEAIRNCDALAKELYSRLFDWIVVKINQSLCGERNKFIGFLDIFGFEIFKKNSFEQLCINYANERLQQLFNNSTFKEEETVYANEGIQFDHIDFIDNTEVLEMIESRYGGLFSTIDDQVRIRNGNDTNLMKNMKNCCAKYKCFDGNCSTSSEFGITHYAGHVVYDINTFTDKNRDRIFDNLYDLITSSSSPFLSSLFPPISAAAMKATVCYKFTNQLTDLVAILERSERKYIRCIKPNDQKKKNTFECVHSLEQMRYSGIFEAVKIRKLGYPFRLSHQHFIHRYKCLEVIKNRAVLKQKNKGSISDQINRIVKSRPECSGAVYVGRTLVLYRAEQHRILELARNLAFDQLLPSLQSLIKTRICMVAMPMLIETQDMIEKALTTKNLAAIEDAYEVCTAKASIIQQLVHVSVPMLRRAADAISYLKQIEDLERRVRVLLEGDLQVNTNALVNVLEEIESQPSLIPTRIHSLVQEARDRITNYAASLIEPDLREAIYSLAHSQLEKLIEQAIHLNYSSDSVMEGKRLLELSEEEFFRLEIERAEQLGDVSRLVDRKIKLRDLTIHKKEDSYAFDKFPGLKTPEEYASYKILTMNKKWWRENAYKHMTLVIPTCITTISKEYDKKGIIVYKNIQGYMKDRKYNTDGSYLALEIIKLLLSPETSPQLRTETYCQIIKQLSCNPNQQSVELGWELLSVLLYYVLPEESFMNYLIVFIWKNANPSEKYMTLLNNAYFLSKYKKNSEYHNGCRSAPSGIMEIMSFLSDFRANSKRYSVDNKFASFGSTLRDTLSVRNSTITNGASSKLSMSSASSRGFHTLNRTSRKPSSVAPSTPPPPPPPPKPLIEYATVLYDITQEINESVLVCKEGDRIVIIKDYGDWLKASLDGKEGFVPYNYVEREKK